MTNHPTVYISIGNSDDKLTQAEWNTFIHRVRSAIAHRAIAIHGAWHSPSDSAYQNACWCIEIDETAAALKRVLRGYCAEFRQDSIAWAEARTEFISAKP